MLVPFATGASEGCLEALRALELPNLQKLLRRLAPEATDTGDPRSLSMPHERALALAHGLAPAEGLIPFAALQARQAGLEPGEGAWAWITPAHWRVASDHIVMAHPRELQLDEDDSCALLVAMQPWFAEDGITLAYDAPLRWLARGEIFRDLPSASLDRVVGRAVDGWMPSDAAGRPLRRLQQEMQMLLYTLPLTDQRDRRGLLPVNSFWVSGTGALPAGVPVQEPPGLQVAPALRDAALREDWQGWAAAWRELDAREGAQLLNAAARGQPVRVTLCGEAGARTWSSAGANAWKRVAGWFGGPSMAKLLEGL